MPYCNIKTNVKVEKKKELSKELTKVIELIPGKTESWLMLAFEDKISMAFKGNSDAPFAFARPDHSPAHQPVHPVGPSRNPAQPFGPE